MEKFLSLLIYPLGFSIVVGIIGLSLWVSRKSCTAAIFLGLSLGWMLLWSLQPVADAITNILEKQSIYRTVEDLPSADVILVFGGVMQPRQAGHPYPNLGAAADRVWHAARLYHADNAPWILLSGVPYEHWLRSSLYDFAQERLLDSNFIRRFALDPQRVERAMVSHHSGRSGQGFLLWKLLQLAIWHQINNEKA